MEQHKIGTKFIRDILSCNHSLHNLVVSKLFGNNNNYYSNYYCGLIINMRQ